MLDSSGCQADWRNFGHFASMDSRGPRRSTTNSVSWWYESSAVDRGRHRPGEEIQSRKVSQKASNEEEKLIERDAKVLEHLRAPNRAARMRCNDGYATSYPFPVSCATRPLFVHTYLCVPRFFLLPSAVRRFLTRDGPLRAWSVFFANR